MQLNGIPVSGGYAFGNVYIYKPYKPEVSESCVASDRIDEEVSAYKAGKEKAKQELLSIIDRLEAKNDDKHKIFKAHINILYDVAIDEDITDLIEEESLSAPWAVKKVFDRYISRLKKGKSQLISERADDLNDVCLRLLRCLNNVEQSDLSLLDAPIILVAHDLLPSDTVNLDREKTLAILTEDGGPTSHSSIIARSYAIPAVLGIPNLLDNIPAEASVAVDACKGIVTLSPDEETCLEYRKLADEYKANVLKTEKFRTAECLCSDGSHIDIRLNIASGTQAELEASKYVDGIGLFRTEFLYMGRDALPDEDEQYEIYSRVLKAYGEKPVALRTLDIGGDKQTGCIDQPHEENPFLGRRALRLCFDMPELFKTQVRAALRAGLNGNLHLMLPMVGSMDDIFEAKKLIREAEAELESKNIPFSTDYKLGIMIEIPSIAMLADLVVNEVDFASIGSNDLCQYTLAVDRMSPSVSKYYQPLNPAVIRLIKFVIDEFNTAGKEICICGEMGGNPETATVLVGLGMRKLSMNISSVAKIKETLSLFSISQLEELSEQVLKAKTSEEANSIINNELERVGA